MVNYAVRYTAEENLISDENIKHLEKIFELPIDEAIDLTSDESDDGLTGGLDE